MSNEKTIKAVTGRAIHTLIMGLNEDHDRDGLKDTPKRVANFYEEFLNPKEFNFTTFDNEDGSSNMIIVKDVQFYSLCEHHMLPFFGTGAIAYIPEPGGKIVGLSKLARTLDKFSRRLQNQERITQQVAEMVNLKLNPIGVAVMLRARHMCMEMRGIAKPGAETITSAMIGVFKTDQNCRNEFLNLINN